MTTFLIEKEPGFGEVAPGLTIPGKIDKMGYKGVDTTEAIFENHQVSADQVLGGETGKGFYQMMDGVEVGRVNVSARAVGVANRAFELAIAYAQQRETFGKPIAQHQAILFQLAEMATKVEASHSMMVRAARIKDRGERNDVEAGMSKFLAAEYCNEVVQQSFRIHGGYGYSKEYEIERLYREAAFLLIGEGTAEIQKMIIGRCAAQGLQAQELIRQGWYGGASPQPQRGTGACSTGFASAALFSTASRLPHSAYPISAERASGSAGIPAVSAAALSRVTNRSRCSAVISSPRCLASMCS